MKKKAIIVAMALAICACAGCGNGENSANNANTHSNSISDTSKKKTLSMDDIPWNVEEGISDGKRYVMMSYTNQTAYTITNFKITFKAKSTMTEDEKASFYVDVQEIGDLSDDDMTELKNYDISMNAEAPAVVNSGETSEAVKCCYYTGVIPVSNIEHYNFMEPDIATIQYVDGDTIYTEYYDFASDKYTTDSETENASYWTDSEMGKKVPKPESKIIKEGYFDKEDHFDFEVLGVLVEDYESYITECKNAGYTENVYESDLFFMAESVDGYELSIDYDEDECSMDVDISKKTSNDKEDADDEDDYVDSEDDWDMEDE